MSESKAKVSHDKRPQFPKRRRFPDDFKPDAVRRVVEEEYTFKAAAKAVGVSEKSLRDWHKRFAPPPRPCGEDATPDELREEHTRLRRQPKRAEEGGGDRKTKTA